MGIPGGLVALLSWLQKVGNFIHKLEESKVVRFMKRNKLFTLIPMAFLSYQIAVYREENKQLGLNADFYKTRLETYYRDWEEIEFGMWEKLKVDSSFIFLGVNHTYIDNYLTPNGLKKSDIIGRNNIEAFGNEVGMAWRRNDSLVVVTGQVSAVEPAQYGDRIGWVFISKWRKVRINGDTTVIGMAIKMDTIQKLYINALIKDKKE